MKYFDNVNDNIQNYSSGKIKPLKDCTETIFLLKKENKSCNPYIKLANNFLRYEEGIKEDTGDWYFYKYLKTLDNDKTYNFPLKNGEFIDVEVDLFKPFDPELQDLVNPQWHLLVSSYAYIDAAFNHMDNIYAQKINEKNHWTSRKPIIKNFRNKSLSMWMKETIQ